MKTLLEIVFTLKEALFRFAWQFWYLAVIALVLEAPLYLVLGGSHGQLSHKQPMDSFWAMLSLLSFALLVFLPAAGSCATFGLLGGSMQFPPWARTVYVIRQHWWTVTKVYIVTGLVAVILPALAYIPARHAPLAVKSILDLSIRIYINVVMAKFALAAPLAVAENTKEGEALKRSWQATRASFWYVLGCTVFAHESENEIYSLFVRVVDFRWSPVPVIFAWLGIVGFVATFAIVVQWFVYIHLRTGEAALTV